MLTTERTPLTVDKNLVALAQFLNLMYLEFARDTHVEAEAPVLTLHCQTRSDGRLSREQMVAKLAIEAESLEQQLEIISTPENPKRPTVIKSADGKLQSILTSAAAPHTPETITINGSEYPAQFIIWLLDTTSTEPLRWGELHQQNPRIIAQLLATAVETAVYTMAQGKQISVTEALEKFIRIYHLTGYGSPTERLTEGNSRGNQSAAEFHVQVTHYDDTVVRAAKEVQPVTIFELVKQLSPFNSVLLHKCGAALRVFITNNLQRQGLEDVRVYQESTFESNRLTGDLSTAEEIFVKLSQPITLEDAYALLIPLYNDLETAYQVLANYFKIYAFGACEDAQLVHKQIEQEFSQFFGLRKTATRSLLAFTRSLAPTYMQLSQQPAAGNTKVAKKVAQMERLQARFLPADHNLKGKELELALEEKVLELGQLLSKYSNLDPLIAAMLATFLIDRIKPAELVQSVRGVASVRFSSFMHFRNLTVGADGHIYTDTLAISPTLGTEIGGAERETNAVLRRAEGI